MIKPIQALAVLPFVGFFSGGFIAKSASPLLFGLPFLLVWDLAWMCITSAVMAILYYADEHGDGDPK